MRRSILALAAATAACLALASPAAAESFGIHDVDISFADAEGATQTQAGSHPYAMTVKFEANTLEEGAQLYPVAATKDLEIWQMPGFIGDQSAVPRCSTLDFLNKVNDGSNATGCADGAAVGRAVLRVGTSEGIAAFDAPVYFLAPSPGKVAKLGFWVQGVPVTIDIGLEQQPPYRVLASSRNISQVLEFFGAEVTLWGTPADPSHDSERGRCYKGLSECTAGNAERPFLLLPRACTGPLATDYAVDSWSHPGPYLSSGEPDLADSRWVQGSALSHDGSLPPVPQGMTGCSRLGFGPRISAQPSERSASRPSGLDFEMRIEDEGLTNPNGFAASDIQKAVVTLPEGVTANPSLAEGLGVCTEDELARERADSAPGEGCPQAAKIGSVEAQTPLLENHPLHGTVYMAAPYANPFGTLLAFYIVIRDPELGVSVRLPAKVEPDPHTGQLVTTVEDVPQVPVSVFRFQFREGSRSPLITPPSCGEYETVAKLYPFSNPNQPYEAKGSFQIEHGVDGGACPQGGLPFNPGFEAGTMNNAAGAHSPLYMRLTRKDGDQDLTKISTTLPQGLLASLVGVGRCSDAQVAQAAARTGPHGGSEEQSSPSCPGSSQIGHTTTGAGVGSALLYVPGNVYLAGPYNGAPLSVVAIVPGLAGPFDVGTIVVRIALRFNPITAQAEVDGAASDPIPHILRGIPLKVRDIRVHVDRPEWTFNPTSCEPMATVGTLWGGGQNVFSTADDSPFSLAARFQAADCANLAFKPSLRLNLKGGTKRGRFPTLRGEYKPRSGDANLDGLVLRLPHSEFIEQGHFKTICTRVQYAAGAGFGSQCPKGSVYGRARAFTPLLEEPLEGPVRLRSSNHNLPDLVASLHGIADIEASARIDSKNGGLRATFSKLPDAPLTKVIVTMQGGAKGLIVNSTNLCRGRHRAHARYLAQNGKRAKGAPLVKATCGKAKSRHHRRHHRRTGRGR